MFQEPLATSWTNPSLRAVSAKDAPPTHDTLIIHHISDPHYGRIGGEAHPLERYESQVARLPDEKQPHLLIITGDLTLTGSREELREAAIHIRGALRANHQQRVFVVPGPHDIDWSNQLATDSFEPLRQALYGMTLPAFLDRSGAIMLGPEPFIYSTADNYLVYLINTVVTPESQLRPGAKSQGRPMPKPFEELHKHYRALWKEFTKDGGITSESARQQFLQQTQSLIDSDYGMVAQADIDRFARSLQSLPTDEPLASRSQPGDDQPLPLKILVTHHPLISYTGHHAHPFIAASQAGQLIDQARHSGFHMVLNGHTHEPHVLSDYPLESYVVTENPLLQISAGSLGAVSGMQTYNSMTAQRDRATGAWSLDLRVIKLGDNDDYPALHFVLSNPTKNSTPVAAPATIASAAYDPEFNYRMQVALEQFNDDMEGTVPDLPVRPMKIIEGAIKEVVFKGLEVRVGLALKQRFATVPNAQSQSGNMVLENRYIDPGPQTDAQYLHPFPYPDTLAAWSLIQGEPLIYPDHVKDGGKYADYSWLDVSGKLPRILAQLKRMVDLRDSNSQRAFELHTKLTTRQLRLGDIFKPAPDSPLRVSFSPHFTSFICMPVPLRPTERRRQQVPEIGVLNVDEVDVPPQIPGTAFTPARIDMLHTIADLITLILLTSNRLGRPKGTFDRSE